MIDGNITSLMILVGSFVLLVIFGVRWFLRYENNGERFYSRHKGYSILEQYAKNLTQLAREGKLEPVIGREKEIRKVIQILSRKSKNNPVLVGKAGVGKTAIVEGLAQSIAEARVPPILNDKQVLALDLSSIIAGTKFRGEFEKRLLAIRDEIIASNRTIILFIDEIHTLAEAGEASGALDADDILKPALARGDLQVVGATTNQEYDTYISRDITLARRLQLVSVSEPTPKQTFDILKGVREEYERFHSVKILDEALTSAVELSRKYLPKRSFPDKAIDLIDEASSKVKLESIMHVRKSKVPEVTSQDIQSIMKEIQLNQH